MSWLINYSQPSKNLNYINHIFGCRFRRPYLYRTTSNSNEHSGEVNDMQNKRKTQNDHLQKISTSSTAEKVPLEAPEEPTTCCMSGCANCVWLDYTEKLTEYYKDGGEKSIKEINEKITDPNIKAYLLHEIRMRNK